MQISMHNWMRAEPIEDTIARLARCGYDAIEISGEPERYDTKHVRKLLQDHKLTCWGSVTLMLADRDLLAKDEAQRAASAATAACTMGPPSRSNTACRCSKSRGPSGREVVTTVMARSGMTKMN